MKTYSIGIDIALVGVLLTALAAPSLAASVPFTGTAAAYPIIDSSTGNSQARADAQTAYNALLAERCTTDMTHVDMNNQRLFPGTYCFGAGAILNGQVLLDAKGDPNAVFVFKMNNRFDVWPHATVVLLGGARAENVFWQIGGTVSIGVNAQFAGTVVSMNSITMGGGSASTVFDDKGSVNGRLWSVASTVSVPPRATVGLFQTFVPVPSGYIVQPPAYVPPSTGSLTVSSNSSDFALFLNGARVTAGQRYALSPGTYSVTEVNLSGTDYTAPSFSGGCSQNGLAGTVVLNAGDDKSCIITNTVLAGGQYPATACAPGCAPQPACGTVCQPGLPNTGFGGSYLPLLNMLGLLIVTAFAWQETRHGKPLSR